MLELKQWHDEKNFFYREFKLYFSQCNINQDIKLAEFLAITSDSAVEDYHQRGITFDLLKENNVAILTSRIAYRFHKMPKCNQIITLKCWEEAPKGLQLTRCYELTDESGEVLVNGFTTWLLVNLENRRIVKPNTFTFREEPTFTTPLKSLDCGKIQIPENLDLLGSRKICFSDLDANGHMNNSRYGEYIIDILPPEFQNRQITDLRLNYAHEAMFGDTLELFGNLNAGENRIVVIGKQGQNVCFESELFFK